MQLDLAQLALATALAWASGVRLYAVMFLVGVLAKAGWIELPAPLRVLSEIPVLAASGFMLVVEFLADKFPGLDSVWDALHTFIRVPAGALLAAGVFGEAGSTAAIAGGLLGGTISAGSHLTKAGSRVIINHSPEPVSNWIASFTEDVVAPSSVLAALFAPWLWFVLLGFFVLLSLLLMPFIWRGVRAVLQRVAG